MSAQATSSNTINTGSWGTLFMPPNGTFSIDVPFEDSASYDMTGKYAILKIRRKNGPLVFTRSTDNDEGSFSNEGTSTQKVTFTIAQDTASASDSNLTFADISLEGQTVEAAVELRATSSSDLDWMVQGDISFTKNQGKIDGYA